MEGAGSRDIRGLLQRGHDLRWMFVRIVVDLPSVTLAKRAKASLAAGDGARS